MINELRAMCAELANAYEHELNKRGMGCDLITRARALLAQPEPEGPTDEELMSVFWEHQNGMEEIWACDWPGAARAVLAKWGHQ